MGARRRRLGTVIFVDPIFIPTLPIIKMFKLYHKIGLNVLKISPSVK